MNRGLFRIWIVLSVAWLVYYCVERSYAPWNRGWDEFRLSWNGCEPSHIVTLPDGQVTIDRPMTWDEFKAAGESDCEVGIIRPFREVIIEWIENLVLFPAGLLALGVAGLWIYQGFRQKKAAS